MLGGPSFPGPDHVGHPLFTFESHDGVDVVRHREEQSAMPVSLLLPINDRFEQRFPSLGCSELVGAACFAVDGDEERRVV